MTTSTTITVLAMAVALAWFGPSLDDHGTEQAQAQDLQLALQEAATEQRFARAAQDLCGPQAAWQELPDGSVQCRTKYGRPTITVKVSP